LEEILAHPHQTHILQTLNALGSIESESRAAQKIDITPKDIDAHKIDEGL
jgi:hypothetical protein